MRIAILTPSRSRPEGLYNLFDSVNKTMSGNHSIDFIVGTDKDDPEILSYANVLDVMHKEAHKKMRIVMLKAERQPLAKIWNSLVICSCADWFTCGNDDEIYITQGWDEILYQRVKDSHPYHLYWFDDGLQHGNHCAFPIVSREWINTLGYFFPEIFIHNYVDTWVFDIACKLNVMRYIPEVQHQHLHHSIGMSKVDQTYLDGMANDANTKDQEMFIRTETIRNNAVELIKSKICQLPPY